MRDIIISLLVFGTVLLSFGGCQDNCEPRPLAPQEYDINAEFDRTEIPLTVTVKLYANSEDLIKAHNNFVTDDKLKVSLDFMLWGWSEWSGENQCTIHINKKWKERHTDEWFNTLGHEMTHCLYGSFHDDNRR